MTTNVIVALQKPKMNVFFHHLETPHLLTIGLEIVQLIWHNFTICVKCTYFFSKNWWIINRDKLKISKQFAFLELRKRFSENLIEKNNKILLRLN